MPMYKAVTINIPKDRTAGKRRAFIILFSRGRTYGNITMREDKRRKRDMNIKKNGIPLLHIYPKELVAGTRKDICTPLLILPLQQKAPTEIKVSPLLCLPVLFFETA